MVILRCTYKFLRFHDITPSNLSVISRAIFGEWYVNIVSTFRGDAFLFVNNPTMLVVVMPVAWVSDLESDFRKRVLDLYHRLSFPSEVIVHESDELNGFEYMRTQSRSVLGCMNDIVNQLQGWAEEIVPGSGDTLQSFELAMSQSLHKTFRQEDYEVPIKIAQEMIKKYFDGRKRG